MAQRRLDLFRFGLVGAALMTGLAASYATPPAFGRPLFWALGVVGVAALQFPLQVSLTHKVSTATAVFFAAALLLPAPSAALLAATSEVVSTAISVVRRTAVTRRPPPPGRVVASAAFNAAHGYLAVLAAGSLLAAGGVSADRLSGPSVLPVLAGAAIAMYAVNLVAVTTAVALNSGTSPRRAFLDSQSIVSVQFSALYVLGLGVAWLSVRHPWMPLILALPGSLVYVSMRHSIRLSQETIRAVERMADMVDRRDPYTYHHSQRVADYAAEIGQQLALRREDIELLRLAGKVHDVGKIGIPDSILLKPGRLDPEEEVEMRSHPIIGYDLLSEFREYTKVRDLVLAHHERFAGGGYPNGFLAGGLPLIAQVIPVADSLDAMTTARPYRDPLPWPIALRELERGAGTQWNPEVVAAALRVFAGREMPAAARLAVAAGH